MSEAIASYQIPFDIFVVWQYHSTFSFDFAPWLRPRVLVWVLKFMLHFLARESTFCWRARKISLQACAWDSFFKESTSLHAEWLKGHRKVRDFRGKLAYKNCTVPTTPTHRGKLCEKCPLWRQHPCLPAGAPTSSSGSMSCRLEEQCRSSTA